MKVTGISVKIIGWIWLDYSGILESDWWPHIYSVTAKLMYYMAPDPCGLQVVGR